MGIWPVSVAYYREHIWALSIDSATGFICHIDHPAPARYSASATMSHKPYPPLGIGLIGLGHHGSRYAKHILIRSL